MEKIVAHSIELIITIGLLFTVIKYWEKKIKGAYFLDSKHIAYSLFLIAQILSIILIVVEGIDPQNIRYMRGIEPFGAKAVEFWSIYGIYILGFGVVYILSYVITTIVSITTFKNSKKIFNEIEEENWPAVLVFGVIMIAVSYCFSLLVLRPFLYEWVSSNAQFIPLH